MKIFIISIFLYFITFNSSFAVTLNPISVRYTHQLLTRLGLLGQKGWLVDRKKALKILQEILEVLKEYPNATYEQVIAAMNSLHKDQNEPSVDEKQVHRLMDEAGLLGKRGELFMKNEEIFYEIKEVLSQYPHAGYLRVTAEINKNRAAKGNMNIIFWAQVYVIMRVTDLLTNDDAFVYKEMKYIRELDIFKQPMFAHRMAESIHALRYDRVHPAEVEEDQDQSLMDQEEDEVNPKQAHMTQTHEVDKDQVYRIMAQERDWLIDRKKGIQMLQEILDVQERYPGASYEKTIFEINSLREVQYQQELDEDEKRRMHRLMNMAGLLEGNRESFIRKNKKILYEIQEFLTQNPGASYLRVAAEIIRNQSAEGNVDITFWPRIYMIMEANHLLTDDDFIDEEIEQIREKEFYDKTEKTYDPEIRIATTITHQYKRRVPFDWEEVYRFIIQQEGWLWLKQQTFYMSQLQELAQIPHTQERRKKMRHQGEIIKEDVEILAEIKEVLADFQAAGIERVTFIMVTVEINDRHLKKSSRFGESVTLVNKNKVYRIMHQSGLLKEKEPSIRSEEEHLLNDIIDFLEQNPDSDDKMLMTHVNSIRPADQQVSEEYFHELMTKAGFLEQDEQSTHEINHSRIYQEIIERLAYNQEASHLRLTAEYNMVLSTRDKSKELSSHEHQTLTEEEHQTLTTETKPKRRKRSSKRHIWLLGEILRVLSIEEYSKYGSTRITNVINKDHNFPLEKKVDESTVVHIMKRYRLAGLNQRPRNQAEFEKIWAEAGITQEVREAIARGEKTEDVNQIAALEKEQHFLPKIRELNERHGYGVPTITQIINKTLPEKEQLNEDWVRSIMRKHNLKGRQGKTIDLEADGEILKRAEQIIYDNPDIDNFTNAREKFNEGQRAQGLKTVSYGRFQRIIREAGFFSLFKERRRNRNQTTSGVGSVGLIAAAEVEESYAQDHITITPETMNTSAVEEFNTSPIETAFSMQPGYPATETLPYTYEMLTNTISKMIEMGTYGLEIAGEAAPLGVGAAVAVSAIATGIHPMTMRSLSPEEKAEIKKWILPNLVGWKILQYPFKSVKFSKFFNRDQLKRAKAFLASLFQPLVNGKAFVQSVKGIGFKAKQKAKSTGKVFVRGGESSTDEVVEYLGDIYWDKGLGLYVDRFGKAVDPNKLFNPTKYPRTMWIKIKDADSVSNSQQVFVRTPKGDQVLDYNNPEAQKWLQYMSAPPNPALKALTNTGKKETDNLSDLILN